jgi:hypothetical protein
MAVQYLCDKCHRVVTTRSELQDIAIPTQLGEREDQHELCQYCIRELNRWLEPNAVEGR